MKYKRSLDNLFNHNRKNLYVILSTVMVSVLTLTVVYAALSTTLNINGNAEVSAASWDIYLDNIVLNNQSATSDLPTITNKTTASFSTTLNKPGDFYEFTIDIVNNGSIDAMIDSVAKTPELSDSQKKYLNYIVEYQNSEVITTKQLVSKNSYVRLKVKVEFRKDIASSDLPTTSETLNLSFKVNYVQADGQSISIPDNGRKILSIISGDLNTVGSEVAIGDEHFYIISGDEDSVTMLAKYNLYVGTECISDYNCKEYDNPTGIQDSTMIGLPPDKSYPTQGTVDFSLSKYWTSTAAGSYVYDSNSAMYPYIEDYRIYLENIGAVVVEARLIKIEELEALGCREEDYVYTCKYAPSWVYATTYRTGSLYAADEIWGVFSNGGLSYNSWRNNSAYGVRPVITISLQN